MHKEFEHYHVDVKGAIILCAGGGFNNRCNYVESGPAADQLAKMGYQCCIVNYRVSPYTVAEGALELARAIRYVRSNAAQYEINPDQITVMGFSAGRFLAAQLARAYDGDVNGTIIDASYVPDELDQASADASALGFVYSNLSDPASNDMIVPATDVGVIRDAAFPPTFFTCGTEDKTVSPECVYACAAAFEEAGVTTELVKLEGLDHGFGVGMDLYGMFHEGATTWTSDFASWLTEVYDYV